MKVLLAEDDDNQAALFRACLEQLGCTVTLVKNGAAALSALRDEKFDALITDMKMPKMTGLELLQYIGRRGDAPPTLLHSSESALTPDLDLSEIGEIFEFARGQRKRWMNPEATRTYLREFIESLAR